MTRVEAPWASIDDGGNRQKRKSCMVPTSILAKLGMARAGSLPRAPSSNHDPSIRSRRAASAKARKSRSRVRRGTRPSMQLWAISASPRRALRRFASTFARNSPARCQKPDPISTKGTSESVSATPVGSFESLNSSVSTTGTITTWRSSSALSSSCASPPALPSKRQPMYSYQPRSSVGFQFC